MMRDIYVAGFAFNAEKSRVILVQKQKPEWQRDLWNGVGGKVQTGERSQDAMAREWREETGIAVDMRWDMFCVEDGPGYRVHFYRSFGRAEGLPLPEKNDVEETLREFYVDLLEDEGVIGNLNWLIPLALDPRAIVGTVHAQDHIREMRTW